MTTLRAHFDGRVFVPDEPVDLPRGGEYELRLTPIGESAKASERRTTGFEVRDGFPVFRTPSDGPPITDEAVKSAQDDEG